MIIKPKGDYYVIKVIDSPKPDKKYRAYVKDKNRIKKIAFGKRGRMTFLDDRSEIERQNYIKRHLPSEKKLIKKLKMSPSVLSMFLLWGKSRDLNENIRELNRLLLL